MPSFQNLLSRLNDDFHTWDLYFRVHATRRMFQRGFEENDLHLCLSDGIIIEEYDEDYPFPSVLISGKAVSGRAMHAVIGIDNESKRLYVITVYEPDSEKWIDNYSRRK